jgi:glucose/arabinose dehydrogenase
MVMEKQMKQQVSPIITEQVSLSKMVISMHLQMMMYIVINWMQKEISLIPKVKKLFMDCSTNITMNQNPLHWIIQGNIYVNVGAFTNSCQENPGLHSKGKMPCNILDSAGGIWQFKADKLNQTYGDGVKFATGLRNVVGLDWNNQANQLFVMQHGRDDLHNLWPELFTERDNAEKPAECMYALKKGDNAGFPYIYFDPELNKKMVAPEYGGDGKTEGSKEYIDPVVAFPAHMAPNALLFYTGNMFPAKYKNGAFIAFHGSWNRAPLPQEGYYVAFVPFQNGKPSGKWEVFANGFSGKETGLTPRNADHRPCGLAQGPDGSLYVTDDQKGTIYRIIYNGK